MNERAKRLTEEFEKLAADEQADLIERLIVLCKRDPELEKVWADEADRRTERYDSGQEPGIDGEDAIAQVRQRLARRRDM